MMTDKDEASRVFGVLMGKKSEEKKSPGFEKVMERLEEIVQKLDEEQPSLDESLNLFEEGMTLARHGEDILSKAEARVEKILAEQDDGSLRTEALDVDEG
jgi:exodeoxyribonuclease VII small subunit